ncbi:hypothetical protein [Labrys wisconsinensis]|uniref:Uncharacterized protein n=1 Tax=Labrys wisconsinensis TaxID=425677 RepID=A0ABU0JFI5_9HYPH|nr:hypothetical protein [Labrys wisconsinensis]MDQ0473044.1 hypothetical protein [Labrys wisconsinensis]
MLPEVLRVSMRIGSFVCAGLLAAVLACQPASASDGTTPMSFAVVSAGADCPGCVVINARGEIMDETARQFAVFIADSRLKGLLPREDRSTGAPKPQTAPRVVVAFDSIGGKVVPALIMGRRIRQSGWTTVVGQARKTPAGVVFDGAGCYSACSMVMLGGVQRFLTPGSKAGVHQFSPQFAEDESFSAAQMNQIVRDYGRQVVGVYDYVKEMGIDISFFITTLRTPFTSMDVVPDDRLIEIGMVTAPLPADKAAMLSDVIQAAQNPPQIAAAPAQPRAAAAALAQPISVTAAAPPVQGVWTVLRQPQGLASARFSDNDVTISLACLRTDTARLEVTFKALDPLDLEHIRAAAFAAKRLRLAERDVEITSVAAPAQGEQGLAALLGDGDLKALQKADRLTFAVLDRQGQPASPGASIDGHSAAEAVSNVMAACRGA